MMYEKSVERETLLEISYESMREEFCAVIDWAVEMGPEADTFLREWREGGTTETADEHNEWADFRDFLTARKDGKWEKSLELLAGARY